MLPFHFAFEAGRVNERELRRQRPEAPVKPLVLSGRVVPTAFKVP